MEEVIKYRVTGAIVLLFITLFCLPFLFHRSDIPTQTRQTPAAIPQPRAVSQIPQIESFEAPVTASVDLDEVPTLSNNEMNASPSTQATHTSEKQAALAHQEPAKIQTAAKPLPVKPVKKTKPVKHVATGSPKKVPAKPAKTKSASQVKSSHGWMVQVASLSNHQHAKNLTKLLHDQGYNVVSKTIHVKSGLVLTRILVGPEKSRASAELLEKKLRMKHHLKGIVLHTSA